jgi:arabinogalactan endo-1,4-beta-galactosidase
MVIMAPPAAHAQAAEPFALGADISWIPQRVHERVQYAHDGQVRDILDILKDQGFNYIRLRLFVDPNVVVPEDSIAGLGGAWRASPYDRTGRGFCGLDSTIAFAQRVKEKGFKFLLDFHYSDTWADPGKQYKPVSWRNLNFAQLTERVRTYTRESVQKFKDNGVLPDMVQVGNEVVDGMIWDDGKIWVGSTNNWTNFAILVNAGINGVKDVDPDILIMMHTISERNPNNWLTTLKTRLNQVEAGAANKIDVIGLSYYPRWHGDLDSLSRVLTTIANNHDIKISVVEYADRHREINDLVFNLPDNKGFGTFVWEPQEFSGDNSLPLFDWRNNRRETNARMALYPQMAIDYGISEITTNVNNCPKPSGAKLPDGINISGNGIIRYHSNAPATVTVYTIQGRVAGRFNIKSPGTYNPAQMLKKSLKPGMYVITVKSANDGKNVASGKFINRGGL